jgi:tetratricopeptide (TPR) repeat protein
LDKKRPPVEQAVELGNQARDASNYKQALTYYQQVQKLDAQDARAAYGLGNVYFDLNCYDSAIDFYRQALNLKANYREAHVGLGYAYAEKERYDYAREQFQQALKLKQDDVEANSGLARIYAKEGKRKEALAQIKLVINTPSVEDQADAYVALGDIYEEEPKNHTEAFAAYKKATSLKPGFGKAYMSLAMAQMGSAVENFDRDDAAKQEKQRALAMQATDNIEKAISYHYKPPETDAVLGIALALQFRYRDASGKIDAYFEAVKNLEQQLSALGAPKCDSSLLYAGGHMVRGIVLFFKGIYEADDKQQPELLAEAAKQFDQAIKLKEDFSTIYLMMGVISNLQGNNENALEQHKKQLRYATTEFDKASAYEQIGLNYLKLQRLTLAVDSLQEAIKRNPLDPSPYKVLAAIYINQNKHDETIALLKKAIELAPEPDPTTHSYLGSTYFVKFTSGRSEQDFDEAIRQFKKAVELKRDYAGAYESLGQAYSSHDMADEALANYKMAAEYNPKKPELYSAMANIYALKKDDNTAIELLKKAISLKADYFDAYLMLGRRYKNKNNYDEAIKWLKKAVELKPDDAEACSVMGGSYYLKDDYDEAIKWLKKAVELEPNDEYTHSTLGSAYYLKDDYDEAIKWLKKAVELKPDYAHAYLMLGRAYKLYMKGAKADEGLSYLKKAAEYDPKSAYPYFEMALIYYYLKDDNDTAFGLFKQTIDLNPGFADAYLYLGQISHLKKNDAEAVKHLQKAIELKPKDNRAYTSLAVIYKRQKNYPESVKLLTSAIELAPNEFFAYKELAKVYEEQQKNGDAIRYYEEALKRLNSDDSTTKNLYLGRIARLKGQHAEAIEYFRKVTFPDGPDQMYYEIGVVYVLSNNKRAALEQHQQLVQLKSALAEELLKRIKEMK